MKKISILFIICFLLFPALVKAEEKVPKELLLLEDSRIITPITEKEVTDESYLVMGEKTYVPYQIVRVVRSIIKLIKYVVPVILVLMGMIDFGKVVLGKPEDQMKKAKSAFIARFVSAILVFLVISIVEIVVNLVSTNDNNLKFLKCFVTEEECKYVDISYPETPKVPTPTPSNTPSPKETKEKDSQEEKSPQEEITSPKEVEEVEEVENPSSAS